MIIVEFTGLTGAGKTTLLNAVKERLGDRGMIARHSYDIVLARYGLDLSRYPRVRSLIVDVVAFIPFLRHVSTRRGRELLHIATRAIRRDAGGLLIALNLARNFAKKIGVYESLVRLNQQSGKCQLAICDEGTLHIAHNLFVHAHRAPIPSEVTHFASTVPVPDCVIWVRGTSEQSVASVLRRGHPRVDSNRANAQIFVENGQIAFDLLYSEFSVHEKLFTVDNIFGGAVSDPSAIPENAKAVVEFLTAKAGEHDFQSSRLGDR